MAVLTEASYRLHNRHCAGEAKNSDEQQIGASERKAETKARKQGKARAAPAGPAASVTADTTPACSCTPST
jgi:hypothetical protein